MKKLFFSASNDVIDQVTDLYDFVWPTASAMWNFRWQIKGFVNEVGSDNITDKDLLNRFDWGSGIHGVNLRRACLEKTWIKQQEQFAKFLLINLFAIYEGWIDALKTTLRFSGNIAKQLQFPQQIKDGKPYGVRNALTHITTVTSPILQNAFYPTLLAHSKNSFAQLDNLLICYRFFKECRNCLAHKGGIANKRAEESFLEFTKIASPVNLNAVEVPDHKPVLAGYPVEVSLRGVVGFGDIILKLVATIDAEISISQNSEKDFINRFGQWANSNKGKAKNNLKKELIARKGQMTRILRGLGLPEPVRTDEIEVLLIKQALLKENYH